MQNKPSILLINLPHYGIHTDTYKYSIYLSKYFCVTYLCIEKNYVKIEDDTNVIYIKDSGSSIKNIFNIICYARKLIKSNNYKTVHITYFKLVSLIKFFNNTTKYILDFRTGAIDKKNSKRFFNNLLMKFESTFFNKITIISESLRKVLEIDKTKSTIIPLGSDKISTINKEYNYFKMFYIGSLGGRDIYKTVLGLSKYIKETKDSNITYDIFGFGPTEDVEKLISTIKDEKLEDIVTFHGRKDHTELDYYFKTCNVGISFIPKTPYFDCQPPTKTFEYINSGMICMATDTSENKLIVNDTNGILFNDTEDDFKQAIIDLKANSVRFKTNKIINSLNDYTWENIVYSKLYPLFGKDNE